MIWGFLSLVFDREQNILDQYLKLYLKKLLLSHIIEVDDFVDATAGITKIIQMMPEIAMDYPHLHEYLWQHVVELLQKDFDFDPGRIRFID